MGKEQLQEEVTVLAVEVPVRVLQKGRAVRNLTREDFEIFENGIKQEITAFEVVSRKIAAPREISTEELKIPPKKRLFLLIFNIFDYDKNVGEGIDYFFEDIFSPGDKIIVLTEGQLLNINIGKTIPETVIHLKETLKKYKALSTGNIYKAYKELRYQADRLNRPLDKDLYRPIVTFYNNYKRIWKEYRKRFINPDLEVYKSIIKRIRLIEADKWALCFQQREMFPKLRNEGRIERIIREYIDTPSYSPTITAQQRNIRAMQIELMKTMDVTGDIPIETIKSLFMQANITFHLILLKSVRTNLVAKDFELVEVSQDFEDLYKQISFSTGGSTTFSNKVVEALQEAAESEDFHYMLVYQPKTDPMKESRKVEVKVNRLGVDLIYLKDIPKIETPPVTISNFNAGNKTISFTLSNYKMAQIQGVTKGIAEVKITIFDENSEKVFDEERTLDLIKKEGSISLNFGQLKPGTYFIIIQVIDKIANEIDVYYGNIRF
jgi:hypothetical protein